MGVKRRKDIRQEESRQARKQARKERKSALMEEPNLVRANGTEPFKKKIILFAEGKNTETTYFKQFKNERIKLVTVGTGKSTLKLVDEAITLLCSKYNRMRFDEKWVVFDKDDNTDFEEAIQFAKKSGFKVAYSNQAIEYWFLLHFNDHQGGGLHRNSYSKQINGYIKHYGAKYDDTKVVSAKFFDIMLAYDSQTGKRRIQLAFDRATKIYKKKQNKTEESITTIHHLIQSITGMEFSKK